MRLPYPISKYAATDSVYYAAASGYEGWKRMSVLEMGQCSNAERVCALCAWRAIAWHELVEKRERKQGRRCTKKMIYKGDDVQKTRPFLPYNNLGNNNNNSLHKEPEFVTIAYWNETITEVCDGECISWVTPTDYMYSLSYRVLHQIFILAYHAITFLLSHL